MEARTRSVALHEATRSRYLSYALSVITSRALPDVRDGLKPVQRRILYAMLHNLKLRPEGRYRKSAAVVGEVMAKYHPHGDQSIYDAMVRTAQPFSLLHPLVDGQGNFGSLDGDPPAAMRYTETKLRPLAMELLSELPKRTVDYRPNYDGQTFEPVVLPARFPQLLVNGSEGIAVGMATKIPPHNLREVIDASVLLIDDPEASNRQLTRKLKGPDFPNGGHILASRDELAQVYETGAGKITVRGEYTTERIGRRHYAIITSLPYGLNKASLVEHIGSLIVKKKLPQLLDVRDESTEDIRIVLELRRRGEDAMAMAFLYKHTKLQNNFHVNLTCLIPTENVEVASPAKVDLRGMLRPWLDFRFQTVRRRFEYELEKLRERIHLLEAFAIIFDALDEAIALIRSSEGKRDAAERLIERFDLDDQQTDAILELRLYKLAKLEILSIREELAEKLAEAERIEAILASEAELWTVVRSELLDLRKQYGRPRRTRIGEIEEEVFEEDAYIVAEDAYVAVTREGWFKRQSSVSALARIRVKEGDSVGWLVRASTRSTFTFLTTSGSAYTLRVDDVPATTGYGEPLGKHFALADGEKVVGVISHDKRNRPRCEHPMLTAVTREGRGLRFEIDAFAEVSTKNGRRYCKVKRPDGVVAAWVTRGDELATLATHRGRMLAYPVEQINEVKGAGKGVLAIKLNPGDSVLAFELSKLRTRGARVVTNKGREEMARASSHEGKRADKGSVVMRRDRFTRWIQRPFVQAGQRLGGEE